MWGNFKSIDFADSIHQHLPKYRKALSVFLLGANLVACQVTELGPAETEPRKSVSKPIEVTAQSESFKMELTGHASAQLLVYPKNRLPFEVEAKNLKTVSDNANIFLVSFQLPKTLGEIQIKRFSHDDGSESDVKLLFNPSDMNSGVDEIDLSGNAREFKIYTYTYKIFENGQMIGSREVSLRRDLLVAGPSNKASELGLKAGKNFLRKLVIAKSALVTEGLDLDLDVIEVLSDEGVIETFSVETAKTSANANDVIHGGDLKLNADFASGQLTAHMRGRDGAKGKDGPPATRPETPPNGKDGSATLSNGISVEFKRSYSQWINVQCPESGKDGEPGRNGPQGGPGSNGGDSGALTVSINDPKSTLVLAVIAAPGRGGEGGTGGEGSLGGKGSLAGRMITSEGPKGIPLVDPRPLFGVSEHCAGVKDGKDNSQVGSIGPKGDDGSNGRVQKSSLTKGEIKAYF